MNQRMLAAAIGAACLIGGVPTTQAAFFLPTPQFNAFQYGDFYSYSLPILAYRYAREFGGGVGPGNPFYIASGPGQISDLTVIGTGANGQPVNTNYSGVDNAYQTPNNTGVDQFQTTTSAPGGVDDPGDNGNPANHTTEFVGDGENTWDARVSALTSFLNGGDLLFFFNNNQVNSGAATNQNLMAWGQFTLKDDAGVAPDLVFDLTNNRGAGGNPSLTGAETLGYTHGAGDTPALNAAPASITTTDFYYILSGGQVTIPSADTCRNISGYQIPGCVPDADQTFNHNLGANQAAYMLYSPELNTAIANGLYDVMQFDFRMSALNNGYEQIFIASSSSVTSVPEPASLALLGLTLPWLMRRRRR